MHDALQKEITLYEKRTPKSAQAHARALKSIPLGVASNYRAYDPYPIFVKEGKGSKIRDIDGNEYLDHNLCFGALMVGHCHPAIVKAIEKALHVGTTFGMPHDMEWELAEEICARYPVEMVRFGSSGTEVTMHACRMARAATKRDKILKFEGSYHGLHDTALVSVKPKAEDYGDINAPTSVPGGLGVPKASLENVPVATFNDLASVERRFKQFPDEIAAIILEPILMNVGLCMPQPGFLKGPREIHRRWNAAWGVWSEPRGDGFNLAAQSVSWRDLQHEPHLDGRGIGYVPRSADARELRARRQAEHEADRGLSANRCQGWIASVRGQRRSERRADAIPEGDSQLSRLDDDRRRSVAALLVCDGESRRVGAAVLVGRAVDDFGAAHRSGYRQAPGGV